MGKNIIKLTALMTTLNVASPESKSANSPENGATSSVANGARSWGRGSARAEAAAKTKSEQTMSRSRNMMRTYPVGACGGGHCAGVVS